MEKLKPVKVRLAEKYAKAHLQEFFEDTTTPYSSGERKVADACAAAYVAGFDRAKSLCVDFCKRYADRRVDPPFSEDEEAEWLKHFDPKKKQPSEHMATIGEII